MQHKTIKSVSPYAIMIQEKPDNNGTHSHPMSGHRGDRRRYPEVAMEGETSFSTPDHQDMKPPTKKPRLLHPVVLTPYRPTPTTRLASFISMEQDIEQHRTWQNNAVENLCRFILEQKHVINGYFYRRFPSDRTYEELNREKEYFIRAARTAETDRVFGYMSRLVVEIFLRPLRLRMKHLLMETNELKHITKNLWNHPMLDGYASWADGMVKESLDAGGVREELAGLREDYEELVQKNVFKAIEYCAEDARINGLIRRVRRWCGHSVANDEVKEKVLRSIQRCYCTARQKQQMKDRARPAIFSPSVYAKWDSSYYFL